MKRLFISDLHLQAKRPDITRALRYFLSHIAPSSDELYLLGDIFEVWIGDDFADPVLTEIQPYFEALSRSGTDIYLIHGNRDFLLGEKSARKLSAKLLPEQIKIELPKRGSALLMHGDELCTDDAPYQAFRDQVRDPVWQQEFLSKSIEERLSIARKIRDESQQQNGNKEDYIMDVNVRFCEELLKKEECQTLIHGHTHRPSIHTNINGNDLLTRVVLGDWSSSGYYLLSNRKEFTLSKFEPPQDYN